MAVQSRKNSNAGLRALESSTLAIRSSRLRDIDLVLQLREAFSPEFERLKRATRPDPDMKSPVGQLWEGQTPSKLLFGSDYPEVNRAVVSILALNWILSNDYDTFVRYQELSLRRESFAQLRQIFVERLERPSDIFALIIVTFVSFLGNDPNLLDEGAAVSLADCGLCHDQILHSAAKLHLIPSLEILDDFYKEEIMLVLKFNSNCNLEQLAYAESVTGSLNGLLAIKEHKTALNMILLKSALNLASAKGHQDTRCARNMYGSIFENFMTTLEVLEDVTTGAHTLRDSYDKILIKHDRMLQEKGFRHLSTCIPEERALLRLIVMGQCASRSRAEWFARAFSDLPLPTKEALIDGLRVDGVHDGTAVVPHFMHALFKEGVSVSRGGVTEIRKRLSSLMRFLARVYEGSKPMLGQPGGVMVRDLTFAKWIVQSQGFTADPDILDSAPISDDNFEVVDIRKKKENEAAESNLKHEGMHQLVFKICRECSGVFEYELTDGGTVKIICGVPKDVEYKAISYVWGQTSEVLITCKTCSAAIMVPMESAAKFDRLMELGGTGSNIWLDALSINQGDHADMTSQLSVMGDIYSKAECVSVLLPPSDYEAYILLSRLTDAAETIRSCAEICQSLSLSRQLDNNTMSTICKKFWNDVLVFDANLERWTYWRRAWTFQEWALARNIEISWEGKDTKDKLQQVKPAIFGAAHMMATYKLKNGQYAEINIGFSRGEVPRHFDIVKRLFPYEQLFLLHDEVDEEQLKFQAHFPHFQTGQILGLRSKPRFSESETIRARLGAMLNALGVSKREARYEADLVCCWASMCNIKYDYRKEDSRAVALQKVLTSLRERGVTIYNFLVNTQGASAEVDLRFTDYATKHQQCNATNRAFFPSAPIFTGRTDTAIHFHHAITQPDVPTRLAGQGVKIRDIEAVTGIHVTPMINTSTVIREFRQAVSGWADTFKFTDVMEHVQKVLTAVPGAVLEKLNFVTVRLLGLDLTAWAVCPADALQSELFVAREELNGTLVIYTRQSRTAHILAYLTVTDQQCGTFLIKTDERGEIDVRMTTPQRSDLVISGLNDDRHYRGKVRFGYNSRYDRRYDSMRVF